MAVDPSNPGTFYATWHVWSGGTNNNTAAGVYKSTDCGATWTDFGGFGQMHDVYVCPTDPDRIWVNNGVRGDFGIWRTDDGGTNWDKLDIEDMMLTGAENAAIMSDPHDTMRFVPDEDDPTCGHFLLSSHTGSTSGNGGIYRTVDGGDTWVGYPAADSGWNVGNAISIVPAFPRGCTGMDCTKDSFWLLGAQDAGGGWWASYDEGLNWDKVHSAEMSHGAMRPYRDGIGQVWIGPTGYPTRSADNGDTWTAIGTVDSGQYWTAVGGVPSGTVSPHTGMTSSWAGRVIAGRWNQCGNCTSSVRYTTETTSPTACFSNCSNCSNCVQNTSGLTDQGSHDFVTDEVNGLLYMSLLSQGIRVLRY